MNSYGVLQRRRPELASIVNPGCLTNKDLRRGFFCWRNVVRKERKNDWIIMLGENINASLLHSPPHTNNWGVNPFLPAPQTHELQKVKFIELRNREGLPKSLEQNGCRNYTPKAILKWHIQGTSPEEFLPTCHQSPGIKINPLGTEADPLWQPQGAVAPPGIHCY